MTNFSRRAAIRLAAVAIPLFGLAAPSWAQRAPIGDEIAKAYGVDAWKQVNAIRWTFNVERPGLNLARSWEWSPKTDTVSYSGKDKEGKPVAVTYERSQLGSQTEAVKTQIDPGFINDSYWLLLPFHLAWDGSATVTDQGRQKLPIGSGSATLVSMKFPAQGGGYAPGDTWDFYVGPNKLIEQIVYHGGSARPPHLVTTTFAGNKKAGPLVISTDHRGTGDGKQIRVFLTGVAVKLAGSTSWINAR